MSSTDLHNLESRIEAIKNNIETHPDISEQNKEYAKQFHRFLRNTDRGTAKQRDYLAKYKQISEYHSFELNQLTQHEKHVSSILDAIHNSSYAVRVNEYQPDTKKMFHETLLRMIEHQAQKPEEAKKQLLPHGFTTNIKEKDKERTDPSKLPTPSDVKKIAQAMEKTSKNKTAPRNIALLLTSWDAGSRIGETMATEIRHVNIQDKTVVINIQGNKNSPNRDVPLFVAAPIMKYYLENIHPFPERPEAPVFTTLKNGEDDVEKPERLSYEAFTRVLRRSCKEAGLYESKVKGQTNHIFRKARISYLKAADIMNETLIDKRVGHVPGSDVTRTYTRLKDSQAANAYLSGYGLQQKEDTVEPDLEPLKCSSCETINSGHRDSCRSCGSKLNEKAWPSGPETQLAETEEVEAMEETMVDFAEEAGIPMKQFKEIADRRYTEIRDEKREED